MAAGVAFKPAAMAPKGLLSVFPTSLFPSKPSVSLRFPRPSMPILFLHPSRSTLSLSFREKLPLLTFVAKTSNWARQEEYDVEEGVGPGLEEYEQEDGIIAEGDDDFVEGEVEEEEESYAEPPEGAKLFVGNLPYDMDSEKLAELFDKAGIVEVSEVIYNREIDRSRGFGFVTMSTLEEANKAVEMYNGYVIYNREIDRSRGFGFVTVSTLEEAKKAVEMFNGYEVGGRTLTVNKAAPRGSRVERTPRERDFVPSFIIYAGNLPWGVDDSRLEQVFSEHGKVLEAGVVYDRETGRSRGFGFVKMATQAEVDDAIAALDGQSLDGRAIRVNTADERPRRPAF